MILALPPIRASCVEPLVGHRDLADIGLDRAERIVRRLRGLRLGQCVEQGRLADVRQADDPAAETHFDTFGMWTCAARA